MKKIIYLFIALLALSCNSKPHIVDNEKRSELAIETQSLKQLQISFNQTGNYEYMTKFILKIDSMIKKYPEQKGLVQVRKEMFEMYGDSLKLKQ
ncbi:MAG: hypothetical protein VB126_08910 [Paludibacter sp.]|nr:hypothetical protein [Paludibacter sp.]